MKSKFGSPYDEYIESMLNSGKYNSEDELIKDAIKAKMEIEDLYLSNQFHKLLDEGKNSFATESTIEGNENVFKSALEFAIENNGKGLEIPAYLRL